MNDSFNNQYGAPEPPAGAHNAHNNWVPPAQQSPANGNHAGKKFFDSIRKSGYFRSESRWIGGVAGGLSRRLNMDPLLIRVVMVILGIVTTGFALIVYAAAWALLPEERDGRIHAEEAIRGNFNGALVAIAVLAILGMGNPTMFTVFNVPGIFVALFWLALLAAGGYAAWQLYEAQQKKQPGAPSGASSQSPAPSQSPAQTAWAGDTGTPDQNATSGALPTDGAQEPYVSAFNTTDSGASVTAQTPDAQHKNTNDTQVIDATEVIDTTEPVPATQEYATLNDAGASASSTYYGPPPTDNTYTWVPPEKPETGKGISFAAALGLFLVVAAGLLAAQATGAINDSVNMVALLSGAALTIGGLMVVVNGFFGRSSGAAGGFSIIALIVGIIASSVLLFGVNIKDGNFHAISDRTITPTSTTDLEDGFAFGVGDFTLDLTSLDAAEILALEEAITVPLAGGIGDAQIVVPNDIPVVVRSALGIGEYRDGNDRHSGFVGQDIMFQNELVRDGETAVIEIQVNMGIGDLRIEEEAK